MRVTRANMQALNDALDAVYRATGVGDDNLGFWLENQGKPYSGQDVAEARQAVVESLLALRTACARVIAVIDGKAAR